MSVVYNMGCTALVRGDPAAVSDFLWDTDNLARHIPHVQALDRMPLSLPESRQLFRMRLAPPGASSTEVVTWRVRLHGGRIHYVQLQTHPLLRSHEGDWLVCPLADGSGSQVFLNHAFEIDEESAERSRPTEAQSAAGWVQHLMAQAGTRSLDALARAFHTMYQKGCDTQ